MADDRLPAMEHFKGDNRFETVEGIYNHQYNLSQNIL